MKVSLNWLKDFVEIRMELNELVNLLTMAGLEVEEATSVGRDLKKSWSHRSFPSGSTPMRIDFRSSRQKRVRKHSQSSVAQAISEKVRKFLWPWWEHGFPMGLKSKDQRSEESALKECSVQR